MATVRSDDVQAWFLGGGGPVIVPDDDSDPPSGFRPSPHGQAPFLANRMLPHPSSGDSYS